MAVATQHQTVESKAVKIYRSMVKNSDGDQGPLHYSGDREWEILRARLIVTEAVSGGNDWVFNIGHLDIPGSSITAASYLAAQTLVNNAAPIGTVLDYLSSLVTTRIPKNRLLHWNGVSAGGTGVGILELWIAPLGQDSEANQNRVLG